MSPCFSSVGSRSAATDISRQIAIDEEYALQSVTVFKKVRDEFTHKCRENK